MYMQDSLITSYFKAFKHYSILHFVIEHVWIFQVQVLYDIKWQPEPGGGGGGGTPIQIQIQIQIQICLFGVLYKYIDYFQISKNYK